MYTVIKRMEVSAAHSLNLSYQSKCENLHGHNWIITVYCRAKELNADGMVVDFSHIKQAVKENWITGTSMKSFPLIRQPRIWHAGYAARYLLALKWKCRNPSRI